VQTAGYSVPARYGRLMHGEFHPQKENMIINKDRITGAVKEFKGSVKATIGKATGDAKLEADGNIEKVEGKVQNAVGGLKDALRS